MVVSGVGYAWSIFTAIANHAVYFASGLVFFTFFATFSPLVTLSFSVWSLFASLAAASGIATGGKITRYHCCDYYFFRVVMAGQDSLGEDHAMLYVTQLTFLSFLRTGC